MRVLVAIASALLLLFPTSAKSQCSTVSPYLASLCSAVRAPPNTINARDVETAIEALVASLTSANSVGTAVQRLSSVQTDAAIVDRLDGKPKEYCIKISEGMKKKNLSSEGYATACLRPTCLDESIKERPATCSAISSTRKSFHDTAVEVGQSIFGPCPAGIACVHADEFAAEVVINSDSLRGLMVELVNNGELPDCVPNQAQQCLQAILARLSEFDRYWSLGQSIKTILEQLSTDAILNDRNAQHDQSAQITSLLTKLDPNGAVQKSWTIIEAAAAKSAKVEGSFPWSYSLFVAVKRQEPTLDKFVEAIEAQIAADGMARLLGYYRRGQELLLLIQRSAGVDSALPPLKPFLDQWKALTLSLPKNPSNEDILRKSDAIQELVPTIEQAEQLLRANLSKLVAAVDEHSVDIQCSKGNKALNLERGVFDFCFSNPENGLVGFRFVFSPCASTQVTCTTSGDLRLLVYLPSSPAYNHVSIPLGIKNIRARVTEASIELLGLPPNYSFESPKRETIAEGLKRFMPPGVELIDVGNVELEAGPVFAMNGIKATVPALGVGDIVLDVSISSTGVRVNGLPSNEGFRNAIAQKLGSTVEVGGLKLSNVRALTSTDKCGKHTYAGSDTLIALCSDLKLDLSLVGISGLSLTEAILVDRSGRVRLQPEFEQAELISQLNQGLRKVWKSLLGDAIGSTEITIESIAVGVDGLSAQLQGSGNPACYAQFKIPFSGSSPDSLTAIGKELLKCKVSAIEAKWLKEFTLFMLNFDSVRADRVCIGVSEICIIGVKVGDDGSVDFSNARLADGGQLVEKIREGLSSLLPGGVLTVSNLYIADGQLRSSLDVTLPYFDKPIRVELAAGKGQPKFDVRTSLYAALAAQLKSREIEVGSLKLKLDRAAVENASLTAYGNVTFGNIVPVDLEVQLLPSVRVSAPKLNAAEVANTALKYVQQYFGRGDGDPQLVLGPDFKPILQFPITVGIPLGGTDSLRASALLEASPGSSIRFAGPIALYLPIWFPVFSGIDVGGIRGQIDLEQPGELSIGASVAITSGEATQNVIAFRGDLSFSAKADSITLGGRLDIVQMTLAQTTGVWQLSRGRIQVNSGFSGILSALPLPQTEVILDARACLTAGTANAKLLGVELVNVGGALFVGSPCKADPNAGGDVISRFQSCGKPSGLGLVCLIGSASIGSIARADARLVVPIDFQSPRITANMSVANVADFSVDASLARAKLGAGVFGLRVIIILPGLTNVTASDLARMLENLLRPSLDWDALKNKTIVISPSNARSNSEAEGLEASAGAAETTSSQNTQNEAPDASRLISPVVTSVAGKDVVATETVAGTANAVRLVVKNGQHVRPYFYPDLLFRSQDGQKLASKQLVPITFASSATSQDGRAFIVMCQSRPCDVNKLSAVFLFSSPNDSKKLNDPEPLGDLASTKLVSFDRTGFIVNGPLLNYVASQRLAKKDLGKVYCVSSSQYACAVAIRFIGNGQWEILFGGFRGKIDSRSLLGRFLEHCSNGDCQAPWLKAITEALPQGVWAVSQPPAELSAILYGKEGASYVSFDGNLAVRQRAKIEKIAGEVVAVSAFAPPLSDPLWTKVFSAMDKMPILPDRSWSLAVNQNGNERLALISAASAAEPTVIAGFLRSSGTACIGQKPYAQLIATLSKDWADGASGQFGGGVSPDELAKINSSKSGEEFSKALINPNATDAGFRFNPFNLFGKVDEVSCK